MAFSCPICLNSLEKSSTSDGNTSTQTAQTVVIVALPCGHVLHELCILQWMECGEGCPCCRDPFEGDEILELFHSKLNDSAPTNVDFNEDEETKVDVLKAAVKALKASKRLDSATVENLRSELSRVNSRWRSERQKAEEEKDELRRRFQKQERRLVKAGSDRDVHKARLEECRQRVEDLEFLVFTERFEAGREVDSLKDRNAVLELECARLREQNQFLRRRTEGFRKKAVLRISSDSDSVCSGSSRHCQLRKENLPSGVETYPCSKKNRRKCVAESDTDVDVIIGASNKKRSRVIRSDTETEGSNPGSESGSHLGSHRGRNGG